MNDQDITQFTQAMKDFITHAEKEIDSYLKWQEARSYTTSYYEQLAEKYEVTVDYILMEFIV
mgnify:CR=1 FL=1